MPDKPTQDDFDKGWDAALADLAAWLPEAKRLRINQLPDDAKEKQAPPKREETEPPTSRHNPLLSLRQAPCCANCEYRHFRPGSTNLVDCSRVDSHPGCGIVWDSTSVCLVWKQRHDFAATPEKPIWMREGVKIRPISSKQKNEK